MDSTTTLACPSCGGDLEIIPTTGQLACRHCAQGHAIKRKRGTITNAKIPAAVEGVKPCGDRSTAGETILSREKEIDNLTVERSALVGAHSQPRPKVSDGIFAHVTIVLGVLFDLAYVYNMLGNGIRSSIAGLTISTFVFGLGVFLSWRRI